MAMINPKDHADTYKNQEDMLNSTPPTGTYWVVNTALQICIVGEKRTKKCRIKGRVLKCIAGEGGGKFVGKDMFFDLWWDLTKGMNAARVSHLGAACRQIEEWDPDDRKQLVQALTGVPYQFKLECKEEVYKGKNRKNVEIVRFDHLSKQQRQVLMDDPGWAKIVGSPGDRMLDDADYSSDSGGGAGGSGGSGGAPQNDPLSDEDPGFSDGDGGTL